MPRDETYLFSLWVEDERIAAERPSGQLVEIARFDDFIHHEGGLLVTERRGFFEEGVARLPIDGEDLFYVYICFHDALGRMVCCNNFLGVDLALGDEGVRFDAPHEALARHTLLMRFWSNISNLLPAGWPPPAGMWSSFDEPMLAVFRELTAWIVPALTFPGWPALEWLATRYAVPSIPKQVTLPEAALRSEVALAVALGEALLGPGGYIQDDMAYSAYSPRERAANARVVEVCFSDSCALPGWVEPWLQELELQRVPLRGVLGRT